MVHIEAWDTAQTVEWLPGMFKAPGFLLKYHGWGGDAASQMEAHWFCRAAWHWDWLVYSWALMPSYLLWKPKYTVSWLGNVGLPCVSASSSELI